MARTLETFPSVRGETRYPWDEWLDGRVWELVAGEDFTAKSTTLKANAQLQAKKRNGRVRTRQLAHGDRQTVVLQFKAER